MDNRQSTWDIFCRVIDNYGDIGVCWRLARQLANEYPLAVRLWVDDLAALRHIWPAATIQAEQIIEHVNVRQWQQPFVATVPADVVIEAFACELPDIYIAAMKRQIHPSRWLNLEYLSAESWVEDCHGLRSVNPQNGLEKIFFFPGFSAKTGGLLQEKFLTAERDQFQASSQAHAELLAGLGISRPDDAVLISLFSYENPAIGSLLNTWRRSPSPIICLVPEGKILPLIETYCEKTLAVGSQLVLDQLTIAVIPFMTQLQYERLLWCCDINFVRGEDSFVRAQWAAKPFVWHIYPQEDEIHLAKLNAFLARYCPDAANPLEAHLSELWLHWNRGEDCQTAWNRCIERLPEWRLHSQKWQQQLHSAGNLAENIVRFCEKNL